MSEIGKFYSFKIAGRKSKISGIVLGYNDNWTLIRYCVDYRLDGYTIFKNRRVKYELGAYEERALKILKLKKYSYKKEPKIPFDSIENILNYIDEHHDLIQVDTKDGEAFDVVKLKGKLNKSFLLDELLPNGTWRDELNFKESIFAVISFDTDYLNSLRLITRLNNRTGKNRKP